MSITEQNGLSHYFIVRQLFYEIEKCSYSSGISTRIAIAILGVQSAGFALFNEIEKCSYSSGISTRIAIAILGAQSAGFALFNEIEKCTYSRSVKGME